MNNNNGALNFNALLNTNNFTQGINSINASIRNVSRDTARETSSMDASFSKLGTAIGTYLSATALQGFVTQLIDIRGEFQKTEIAFTTMLGSASQAKELMNDMVNLAAKTPFGLKDVSDGAKRLLAFQVPANEVVETLQRMGDVAAGLGVPMNQLIHVYGQVKAQGKLMTNDLYQFMNAGIPMVAELAKVMGVAESKVKDLISEGKVGFPEVQAVIKNLTDEGGMFFNLMEKQSESLSGKVANLMDMIDQMINEIGQQSEGILGDAIDTASALVENYEKIAEVLAFAIATYGAYRVALLAQIGMERIAQEVALQRALAQTTLNTAQVTGAVVTTTLQRAVMSLNAALASNAVGLLITALGALAYVIYDNVTATNAYEESLESLKTREQEYMKDVESKTAKVNSLISVIKDQNTSNEDAEKALRSLNKITNNRIDGLSVEAIRLGKTSKAIDVYIQMLQKEAKAKAILKQIEANETLLNREKVTRENTTFGDRFSNYNSFEDVLAGGLGLSGESAYYRKLRNRNQENLGLMNQNAELNAKLKELIADGVNLSTLFGEAGDEVANTIDDTDKKTKKKLAEVFSKDSLADIQQRLQLWQEALEKSTGDVVNVLKKDKYGDTQKTGLTVDVATALKNIEILERMKAKREKELRIQSFDDQMSEAERHWNNYYRLAEYYGKETADAQYAGLIKGADSYLGYLNKILEELNLKKSNGILTEAEAENLVKVISKIQELTGSKTQLQNWNDELNKSLETAVTISEKIEIINNKIKEVQAGGNSNQSLDFVRNAEQQREQLEATLREQYNNFIKEQMSYEEKSAEITKRYDELRKQATKNKADESVFNKIDMKESEEQINAFIENLQKDGQWLKMFTNMNSVATQKLKEFRQILVKQLSLAKNDADKIKIGEFIEKIDDAVRDRNPFQALKDSIDGFGDDSKDSQEKLDALGQAIEAVKESIGHMVTITNSVEDAFEVMGIKMDNTFGDIIESLRNTLTAMQDIIDGAMSIVRGLASGNYIQAIAGAVQLIVGAVRAISSWFNGDKRKEREIQAHRDSINELALAYRDLEAVVRNTYGTMRYQSQLALVDNLKEQRVRVEEQLRLEQDKKRSDKDKVNSYRSALKDIDDSIAEIQNSIMEDILQTDVADAAERLGNALADAFGKGTDAANELNNVANDLIRNMLKNQMSLMLQNRMKPILANLLKSAGFNEDGTGSFEGLSQEEIQAFKDQVQKAGQDMQGFLDSYSDIFKGLDNTESGLKSGIKREITEQTASELTGLFRAYYDVSKMTLKATENQNLDIKSQVQIVSSCYNTLQLIESNTMNTVARLDVAVEHLGETVKHLQSIDSNLGGRYS